MRSSLGRVGPHLPGHLRVRRGQGAARQLTIIASDATLARLQSFAFSQVNSMLALSALPVGASPGQAHCSDATMLHLMLQGVE
jgi:hypothetical protein